MTIHSDHPFSDPEGQRDPVRRFRGRLTSGVSLWVSGDAGLTVSSVLIASGSPAMVVGLIDPDSDLAERLIPEAALTVSLLSWQQRGLADAFGYVAPAPGGPFAQAGFIDTDWGRVPIASPTWLGARVASTRELGWSREVVAVVESVSVGDDDSPLVHRRGRWVPPA